MFSVRVLWQDEVDFGNFACDFKTSVGTAGSRHEPRGGNISTRIVLSLTIMDSCISIKQVQGINETLMKCSYIFIPLVPAAVLWKVSFYVMILVSHASCQERVHFLCSTYECN